MAYTCAAPRLENAQMSKYFTTVALAIAALGYGIAGSAQGSTLYRCTDEAGHTTYSTSKGGLRNCTVISEDRTPAPKQRSVARVTTATAPDFPRVSNEQQRSRDTDRRYLLEQELQLEQKHLNDAKKSLTEQEAARAPAGATQSLRDQIAMHERNLDALKREMATLK